MEGTGESTSGDARETINQRIAEIRSAGFTPSRRGYDRDEVQRYLGALADWLESLGLGDADRGELRREFAWVGERTSEILNTAEEEARRVRFEAGAKAEETIAAAEQRAEELLAEAARRRQDLQTLIGDLLERRDEIVADGVRLADELAELFATADEGEEDLEPEDVVNEDSGNQDTEEHSASAR